jgi:hypothetical protein
LTFSGAEVTTSNAAGSFGVKLPVKANGPPDAGVQAQRATNGATKLVEMASQPVIAIPVAKNLTLPALFAVAVIVIGPNSKTPLPPVIINVEATGAAYAGAPPTIAPPKSATALMTATPIFLFISTPYSGLFTWVF